MSEPISFSQVDITEGFGDDQGLGSDEWIATTPLNATTEDAVAMGLLPLGATKEEIYRVADRLSTLRESFQIPNDGVYCPVCHKGRGKGVRSKRKRGQVRMALPSVFVPLAAHPGRLHPPLSLGERISFRTDSRVRLPRLY
jgi:hypothetical protein